MNEPPPNAYDEVTYPSTALAQTHPEHLATIATLLGLAPAPIGRCRVLELGCGDGANLIPMALALPQSEFIGIDIAAKPIAEGQEAVRALGLKNLRLDRVNLLDLPAAWGTFDYLIAHGLYAWVPRLVQDKLLAVCHDHLAPQGVAYVSYNTYPGSHLRDMLREMMRYRLREPRPPREMIRDAKALVRFLATPRAKIDPWQVFLKAEAEQLLQHADGHLYHDELADINGPVYFHQFAAHAAEHQLQYLAEADYYEMQDFIYPPEIIAELDRLASSRLEREQYLDFLKCRRFRQTLLCHAALPLRTDPLPATVRQFAVSSPARPVSAQPNLKRGTTERFTGKRGAGVETDHPLTKAALLALGRIWPHRLPFDQLLERARALLAPGASPASATDETEAGSLCGSLLEMYGAGLVEFHLHTPPCAMAPGAFPTASALARHQIQRHDLLTNLYHQPVKVEGELAKTLLLLLDGTRDRARLASDMAAAVQHHAPSSAKPDLRILAQQLDKQVAALAQMGLLVG